MVLQCCFFVGRSFGVVCFGWCFSVVSLWVGASVLSVLDGASASSLYACNKQDVYSGH